MDKLFYKVKNLVFIPFLNKLPELQLSTAKVKNGRKKNDKKLWPKDKTLVGTEESAGAVIQRCPVNKVFWKYTQSSQENTFAGVSF